MSTLYYTVVPYNCNTYTICWICGKFKTCINFVETNPAVVELGCMEPIHSTVVDPEF